ncbi:MAG TPA: RHS repeat-associated core domain-containing protein [Thermoanaerobaculia bacterium]|jgi:RHS repeat-associated protein|nr:RHS repeat-associated core domain-containing protein [Thermoanaerobaculia bacterium]
MAVFLLRAKEGGSYQPPPATGTMFGDVPASYLLAAWIEELARRGITSGCGNGNYCPNDPVRRDQMSTLLVRTFNLATQSPTLAADHTPIQSNAQSWTSGEHTYDGAGNIVTIGTAAAPGTQGYRTYGYDTVMRLKKAEISGVIPAATHEYNYDAYGNRTGYGVNSVWTNIGVSSTTNRMTNATYDASGNQTAQLATAATYDGFNMATSYRFDGSNLETFVYTANDERIGVLRGTDWTWSLRGADGLVLRQYRSSSTNPGAPWVWIEDFVYRGGLMLGSERVAGQGGRRHYHLDHLGSPRLVTGANGSVISEHDVLPFGEERTTIGQHQARGYDREEPLRFTSHERDFDNTHPNDSSSYIDYMHARYYATKSGRFLSVDPAGFDVSQPQSFNRYSYAINNPVNRIDPTGRSSISAAVARARRAFWGSVDTGVDLAHFLAGTLPAESAGTADEAANLAATPGMENVRDEFVANGCQGTDENGKRVTFSGDYNYGEFGNTRNGTGHLVGGFNAYVRPLGDGNMLVYAFNYWGRESASRLPKELGGPGAPSNRRNPSIQDMINGASRVWPPKSVLNNVSSGFMTTVRKNYIWIEPLPCGCN